MMEVIDRKINNQFFSQWIKIISLIPVWGICKTVDLNFTIKLRSVVINKNVKTDNHTGLIL